MNNQERSDMKKLFLILLFTFFPIKVLASNGDNSVDIRYKWYQEKVIDEVYYPKGMILDGYMEDITNIKYGLYSEWKEEYCDYSEDYYNKEYKDIIYYDSIVKTRYIKIEPTRYYQCEDGSCFDEIRVYNEMNLVNYNIIQVNEMGIILELEQEYDTSKLWFYIDTHSRYSLYLSYDKELTQMSLGHYITSYIDGKIVIPDDTWILSYAKYVPMETNNIENITVFDKNVEENRICRVREIMTYRYKKDRIYYDNNYYTYIDNYIPDIYDYVIANEYNTYKNDECKSENLVNNESGMENVNNEIEYQDVYVYRIPYIVKVLLVIMFLIILLLIVIKKNVD